MSAEAGRFAKEPHAGDVRRETQRKLHGIQTNARLVNVFGMDFYMKPNDANRERLTKQVKLLLTLLEAEPS